MFCFVGGWRKLEKYPLIIDRFDIIRKHVEGITTLLTDSEKAKQFGNEARQIVEEKYDQKKILSETYS